MIVVIIGNGKSRQHMDLDKIKEKAWTFGCNALYRDFSPDFLLTVDPHCTHEILDSDYSLNNKVVLSNMNPLPGECRDALNLAADHEYENESTGYKFFFNGWGDKKRTGGEPQGSRHYITWIKEKSQIMTIPWEDDGWGLSAGIQAVRVSHHFYPKATKYLIGFDIFGERDNIYDGTEGYPKAVSWRASTQAPNRMTEEFKNGFEYLLNTYDDLIIKRVIDQNQSLENIPNVSEDELWQNLANNQKI